MSMEVVYKCIRNLLVLEMSAVVPICLLISILKTFTVYICHKGKLPSTIQQYYWKSRIVFVFGSVFHFQYMHRSSFCSPYHWKTSSDYPSPPSQLVNTSHYGPSCLQYVTCFSHSKETLCLSLSAKWMIVVNRHRGWIKLTNEQLRVELQMQRLFVIQIKLIAG